MPSRSNLEQETAPCFLARHSSRERFGDDSDSRRRCRVRELCPQPSRHYRSLRCGGLGEKERKPPVGQPAGIVALAKYAPRFRQQRVRL
jgi:hypothetical protein